MDKHKIIIWISTILGLWFIPLGYLIWSKNKSIKNHAKIGLIISLIEALIILYIFIDGYVLRYL